MMRIISAFVSLLLVVSTSYAYAWKVTGEQARCIVENAELYQNNTDDPVAIFPQACPTTDLAAALAELEINSGAPSFRESENQTSLSEIIFYTHSELACLAKRELSFDAETVDLPDRPCED